MKATNSFSRQWLVAFLPFLPVSDEPWSELFCELFEVDWRPLRIQEEPAAPKKETGKTGSSGPARASFPEFEKRHRFRCSPTRFRRPEYPSALGRPSFPVRTKWNEQSRGVRSDLIARSASLLSGGPADSWSGMSRQITNPQALCVDKGQFCYTTSNEKLGEHEPTAPIPISAIFFAINSSGKCP